MVAEAVASARVLDHAKGALSADAEVCAQSQPCGILRGRCRRKLCLSRYRVYGYRWHPQRGDTAPWMNGSSSAFRRLPAGWRQRGRGCRATRDCGERCSRVLFARCSRR